MLEKCQSHPLGKGTGAPGETRLYLSILPQIQSDCTDERTMSALITHVTDGDSFIASFAEVECLKEKEELTKPKKLNIEPNMRFFLVKQQSNPGKKVG